MNVPRTLRLLGAATVLATVATVATVLTPAVAGATAPSGARAPVCTQQSLELRAGRLQGAAGTTYRRVNLVNTGGEACRIAGFPRVAFRDAAGHRIGLPSRTTGHAHTAVVPAGGKAHVNVGVPNPANFAGGGGGCEPRRATGIRVRPPHRDWSVRLDWRIEVCSLAKGRTTVDAVHRGGA